MDPKKCEMVMAALIEEYHAAAKEQMEGAEDALQHIRAGERNAAAGALLTKDAVNKRVSKLHEAILAVHCNTALS